MEIKIYTEDEGRKTNCRIKINPKTGEILECAAANRSIFARWDDEVFCADDGIDRAAALERKQDFETEHMTQAQYDALEQQRMDNLKRSANRAKKRVFDIAACNQWDYFVTLTLDKTKVDRYDYKASIKPLQTWLDNRVRRKGLRYVGVPELHKDGAIHYHLLCNEAGLRYVDSGKTSKGRKVYNLPEWQLGFSTAVRCDGDTTRTAAYIAKYVTKQIDDATKNGREPGAIGGRYYLHGGKLDQPEYIYGNVQTDEAFALWLDAQDQALVDGERCAVGHVNLHDARLELYYFDPTKIDIITA